jgi:putative transposase
MKRKRFSTEQIVAVLKQAEMGLAVADLIRQVGISEQTFYRWKKQYGGLQSEQVRELKQLVDENARLKKLVAELSLDKAVLQDVLSKNSQASAHEGRCRLRDGVSRLQRAAGLRVDAPASIDPTQTQRPESPGGGSPAHPRHCEDAHSIWLSTRSRHAPARGLDGWPKPYLSSLSRGRSALADQTTTPTQNGRSSRGTMSA